MGAAQDLVRLLRGRKGDHRSHLDCAWVWDGHEATPDTAHLLDPCAWSVHVEVRVAGRLDDTRMRKAFDTVIGHRPAEHDPLRVVTCDDDEALDGARDGLLAEPVPMHQWPPLQAVLAHHPEGDVLLLNVNHAASDGFSAVRVMESIAGAYADTDPPGPPLDFLAVNDLPVRPASKPVSAVEAWYRVAVERVRDLLANPAHIAPDHPADRPGYGFHFVRLSVADTRRVANVHRQGTARNVMLAALHLAIGEWNLEHGTPGRRIGVLVPGRPAAGGLAPRDRRQLLGDGAGVDQPPAPVGRPGRPQGHHRPEDPQQAVPHRRGPARGPGTQRAPAAVGQAVARRPAAADPEQGGGHCAAGQRRLAGRAPVVRREAGETTAMWCSLPARAPHSLCVGAVVVGGQLHLTFRYPHRLFDAGAARRFAESYVEHVIAVAERRW